MKTKPYVFLLVLVVILIFILGVRYGQKVEKTNKTINYLISLPPTKPPLPSIALETKKYLHEGCTVSFMYPAWWKTEKQSTQSADFYFENKSVMTLQCNKTNSSDKPKTNWLTTFQKKDPKTGMMVTISINDSQKNWFQLIEKTFEFTTP